MTGKPPTRDALQLSLGEVERRLRQASEALGNLLSTAYAHEDGDAYLDLLMEANRAVWMARHEMGWNNDTSGLEFRPPQ